MAPVIAPVQKKDRPAHLRLLARILPQSRNRLPFVTGVILAPLFVFFHEAAHFGAARVLGFKATLHSGLTTVYYAHLPLPQADLVVTGAGPFLQVLIGVAGLVWLYRLRGGRKTSR